MKHYRVDLRSIPVNDREAVCTRLDRVAFLASWYPVPGVGIEFVEVFWDSKEDFESSPFIPHGCPCVLLSE